MKNTIAWMLCCITISLASAQMNQRFARNAYDPRFPTKGSFHASVLTTYSDKNPPPILLGEILYGVSSRFSVAVVGGTVGVLGLYGGKVNGRVYSAGALHINAELMSVYYPERNGKFLFDRTNKFVMPWGLSTGTINAEWTTDRNIRWTLGVGLTETHCIEGFRYWVKKTLGQHPEPEDEDDLSPFDVMTTVKGSVSVPLSTRMTFRPEVFANFQQGRLIERGKHKVGFPIIASATLVYAFRK